MAELDVPAFVEAQVEAVKAALGDNKALVAVSGGVDSTVSALIVHEAIGDNLACVFIDDNYMRLGEAEQVRQMLSSEPLNLPIKVLNERQRFMDALSGLSDAEEKRKAFRKTFYKTLSDAAKKEECKYLVQGTIRADIEETAGGIKTQHNILEQIGIDPVQRFGFTVIEPVKSLYKYQVREVARFLGAPIVLTERQPFPGPGLSVRVVGLITPEKLDQLKKATFITEESFEQHSPSQYFCAIFEGESSKEFKALKRSIHEILELENVSVQTGMLNEKATGIINQKRAYGVVMTLAFVNTSGDIVNPGYEHLPTVLNYVEDNYPEVTRLLIQVQRKDREGYVISLRAVKTRDFLTAQSMEIPWSTLKETASRILDSCIEVSSVYYDVTPKPPATIEYE